MTPAGINASTACALSSDSSACASANANGASCVYAAVIGTAASSDYSAASVAAAATCTGNDDGTSDEGESPAENTGNGLSSNMGDAEGGIVIAGSKQDCSCATSQGKMQWTWVLALLVWSRRRKEMT